MSPHRRILFVCLHGAAKSVLAAVDCESLAAARGLDIRADFAGTEPDLGGKKPRLVTSEDVVAADQVVAFGCNLGSAAAPGARIEQWADVPAVSDGLPAARSAIRAHLERLIDGWARR